MSVTCLWVILVFSSSIISFKIEWNAVPTFIFIGKKTLTLIQTPIINEITYDPAGISLFN